MTINEQTIVFLLSTTKMAGILEKILKFNTETCRYPNRFRKYYYNINDEHWTRIKTATLALSSAGIGPKVLAYEEEDDKWIDYQIVTPLDSHNKTVVPGLTNAEVVEKIEKLVTKMHSLGYGHGDLHPANLGFIDERIYILDHDTCYRIADGPVPWLQKWMDIGFYWEGSFEEFVNYDYNMFRSDSLHL